MPEYTFNLAVERSYKNKLLSLSVKNNNGLEYPQLFIDVSAEWLEDRCNTIAECYPPGIWIFLYKEVHSNKINIYIQQIEKDDSSFKVIALPLDINNTILQKYRQYHSNKH